MIEIFPYCEPYEQKSNSTIITLNNIAEDYALQIVEEYGTDTMHLRSGHGIDPTTQLYSYELADMIQKHGIDVIEHTKIGYDLSGLDSLDVWKIIEKYGIGSVKPSSYGIDFNEFNGYYLIDAIKDHGMKAIKRLEDVDYDLSRLEFFRVEEEIIDNYGIKCIRTLSHGIDFNKFEGFEIADIIKKYGLEAIPHLIYAKYDFSKLEGYDLYEIIEKYGVKAIDSLNNGRSDFSKLHGSHIQNIIENCGIGAIEHLVYTNYNFSKLEGYDLYEIIYEHGVESINLLNKAGANFAELHGYHISEIINKYGIETLEYLKTVRSDFSKLEDYCIKKIIEQYGKVGIIKLAGSNIDFRLLAAELQAQSMCFNTADLIDLFKMKNQYGFSLGYYFLQLELTDHERTALYAIAQNNFYDNGKILFKEKYSYLGNTNPKGNIMFITGYDHNGALKVSFTDTYYKKIIMFFL